MALNNLSFSKKQTICCRSTAQSVLYGGSRGGGKSFVLRHLALLYALYIPGIQVFIFRRKYNDLKLNHLFGPEGFQVLLKDYIDAGICKINYSDMRIVFNNGSIINLCHCAHSSDMYNYQGAEFHVLMIDEATHFEAEILKFFQTNLRLGDWEPDYKEVQKNLPWIKPGHLPRQIYASNPGGIGHNHLKSLFIDRAKPLEIWRAPPELGGMTMQYIPAVVYDNPAIASDPVVLEEYINRIKGLGDPSLVRMMLHGDWSVVSGSIFGDIWNQDTHILDPFDIPHNWIIHRNFDWGSSKPFAVTYHAITTDEEIILRDGTKRSFVNGTVILIHEIYGQAGDEANVGCKKSAREVGELIRDTEDAVPWGSQIIPGAADNQIFNALLGGQYDTINDQILLGYNKIGEGKPRAKPKQASFEEEDEDDESIFDISAGGDIDELFIKADKSPGSRVKGWELMRSYLKSSLDEVPEYPGYFIFNTCRHSIRTLPTLPRDEKNAEDVNTHAEDHIGDCIRYELYTKNYRFISMDVAGV